MTHWGWYWKVKKKHIPRKLCSQLPKIDSFELNKKNEMTEFIVKPLDIKARLETDHLKVTYRQRKNYAYTIPLDKQPCNYGGYRYFFRCPLCLKRMRILYLAEHSLFLCRKCLNLSYESQRLRPAKRFAYMSKKMKNIVKKKGGNINLNQKPPNMHRKTYQRLRSKQLYYEAKSHQAINKDLRKWFGLKIEPYIDRFFDYVDESKDWRKKPL